MTPTHPPGPTIAARASAPGVGGIGVIRVSGDQVRAISKALIGTLPADRLAHTAQFLDASGEAMDYGLALFFAGPASYTGEDVLELHCHGSPVVLDIVLQRVIDLGARLAKPGEFTERAFLNGKLDLAQAEAVADLIESQTVAAARYAVRSLNGRFSREIDELRLDIEGVRTIVEANIDFSDEPIDEVGEERIRADLQNIRSKIVYLLDRSRPGALIREGARVVVAGPPNAGKSSLLNAFAGAEKAIVSTTPGTTRDLIQVGLEIRGLHVQMIDTAGLRDTRDEIEAEGVKRARDAIDEADMILIVLDDADPESTLASIDPLMARARHQIIVYNKCDLSGRARGPVASAESAAVAVSATDGGGIESLSTMICSELGFQGAGEDLILARRRHIDALQRSMAAIERGLLGNEIEIVAEDLRAAHHALGEIVGEFSTEDLLGEIFSSFCIGK